MENNMIQCSKCGIWLLKEELQDHLDHKGKFAPKIYKWSKGRKIKNGCEGNKSLLNTLHKINRGEL